MKSRLGNVRLIGVALAFFAAPMGLVLAIYPAGWPWALVTSSSLLGVVVLRTSAPRTSALLVCSISTAVLLLNGLAAFLAPASVGEGLIQTVTPQDWIEPDPNLGYRLKPSTNAVATARFGGKIVYQVGYSIDRSGARWTPPAPLGASTYLFVGDSFIFGTGLSDIQTVASQFAIQGGQKSNVVNLGVPGYSANHLVRALESGALDRYANEHVKAVITWIIPAHLARVTGDENWLSSSPRYILVDGTPAYAGTFGEARWRNPLLGIEYLAHQNFAFSRSIGIERRQKRQVDLFLALIRKLQSLVQRRLGAPLIVVYSWPDEDSPPRYLASEFSQALLVATLGQLRSDGMKLLSVNALMVGKDPRELFIPHDGHPSAFTNRLVASELVRVLVNP